MRSPATLTLLPLVCACGAGTRYEATEKALLQLPEIVVLELARSDLPVLRARLDGHADLLFLVDSGSNVTSLEPGRVAELGLQTRPYSAASETKGADGRRLPFDSYVPVDSFEIGGLRLQHLRLPVIDNAAARHNGWAGILGQDVLARLPVILEAQRGQLHLLPPGWVVAEISDYLRDAQLGDGRWSVLELEYRPCPYLKLSVPGEPAGLHELLVDSGATHTSMSLPVIEALGLEPVGSYRARSIAGEFEGQTCRLEGLGLLGLEISADVRDAVLGHGMMGMDVLGTLVVVFDGASGDLWLHLREGAPADADALTDQTEGTED